MAIICNILRFLGKEFLDRSLIQQRSVQNSQHFVCTPVQFKVVLNDSHHAICGDGRVYLDSDSSLCSTSKGLNLKMLLNPFKDEFSAMVKPSAMWRRLWVRWSILLTRVRLKDAVHAARCMLHKIVAVNL